MTYFTQRIADKNVDYEGYPGWSMLRADLADCRRFFTQDLETNPYNPKEPE